MKCRLELVCLQFVVDITDPCVCAPSAGIPHPTDYYSMSIQVNCPSLLLTLNIRARVQAVQHEDRGEQNQ